MNDRDMRLTGPEEAGSRGRPFLLGRMPGAAHSTRLAYVYILWSALRHSLINAFRSSPLRDLALASALHFFIFSCWVMGMASPLPLRQEDMNALRSSPFLSPAWALHAFMRSCCGFDFFSSAAEATESVPTTNDIATAIASTVLMSPPSLNVEAAAQPRERPAAPIVQAASGSLVLPPWGRSRSPQENTRTGGSLADVGHRASYATGSRC